MSTSQVLQQLQDKLNEAESLLKQQEREVEANPNSFAKKLTLDSFTLHVKDLRNQVAAHEAFEHGWDSLNNGRVEDAKIDFHKSIELVPSYLGFLHNQLLNNAPNDDLEVMINTMRFILELDPTYEIAKKNLAHAFIKKGIEKAQQENIMYAISLFQIVPQIVNSKEVWSIMNQNLAVAYTDLGKKAAQKGELEQASVYMLTAFSYMQSGDTKHNVKLSLGRLALACLDKGDFNKAVETFEQLELLFGWDQELWNDYAIALAGVGRTAEGINILEKLLQETSLPTTVLSAIKNNLVEMKKQHQFSFESFSKTFSEKGTDLITIPAYVSQSFAIAA